MNILYLHCHDAGRYIQPYGHCVPTPHLQLLAHEGLLFRNAHCAAPTCTPSRVAMLTGMPAHEAGVLGLAHRGFALQRPEIHLAHYLRSQGYETVLSGIQHEFVENDPKLPYDVFLPPENDVPVSGPLHSLLRDEAAAGAAANWLLHRQDPRPFFLSCGFFFPHRDYPGTAPDLDPHHLPIPPIFPDSPEVRADFAAHATATRIMDNAVGIVLRALHQSGRTADTLVLFTTDHGIAFPCMKCCLTAHGTGVALILRHPHHVPAGTVTDALVSQIDLFPTLCELAGLPTPAHCRGVSLVPVLRDPPHAEVNEAIYSEVNFHAGYEPMRSIRTKHHNYIRRFARNLRHIPVNCDDGPTKDLLMSNGLLQRPISARSLFDLDWDPQEVSNLSGLDATALIEQQLESQLLQWMRETNDPLLEGPLSIPVGARINQAHCLSFREKSFCATGQPFPGEA